MTSSKQIGTLPKPLSLRFVLMGTVLLLAHTYRQLDLWSVGYIVVSIVIRHNRMPVREWR